jgi:hypothetical protein
MKRNSAILITIYVIIKSFFMKTKNDTLKNQYIYDSLVSMLV